MIDYRDVAMKLIASLTLSEHMGDVCRDLDNALEQLGEAGILAEWDEAGGSLESLGAVLGRRKQITLCGTALYEEEIDES
jgi:hypothetical protein